jgi:heat-inducible transcriptional repressor
LIELIEDKNSVVSLVEDNSLDELTGIGEVSVRIGTEHRTESASVRYSIIAARYQLGDNVGTIGVIGPTRMDYGRVVSLVEGMAAILNGRM